MNKKDREKLFKQYGAKTEQELLEKMNEDAKTIVCIVCRKKMKIEKAIWLGGDPYCKECL